MNGDQNNQQKLNRSSAKRDLLEITEENEKENVQKPTAKRLQLPEGEKFTLPEDSSVQHKNLLRLQTSKKSINQDASNTKSITLPKIIIKELIKSKNKKQLDNISSTTDSSTKSDETIYKVKVTKRKSYNNNDIIQLINNDKKDNFIKSEITTEIKKNITQYLKAIPEIEQKSFINYLNSENKKINNIQDIINSIDASETKVNQESNNMNQLILQYLFEYHTIKDNEGEAKDLKFVQAKISKDSLGTFTNKELENVIKNNSDKITEAFKNIPQTEDQIIKIPSSYEMFKLEDIDKKQEFIKTSNPSIHCFKNNHQSYIAIPTAKDIGSGANSKVNEVKIFKLNMNESNTMIINATFVGNSAMKTSKTQNPNFIQDFFNSTKQNTENVSASLKALERDAIFPDNKIVVGKVSIMENNSSQKLQETNKVICLGEPYINHAKSIVLSNKNNKDDFLKHFTKDNKLNLINLLDFGENILEQIKKLHENDIVHRDIKPANLVYTETQGGNNKILPHLIDLDSAKKENFDENIQHTRNYCYNYQSVSENLNIEKLKQNDVLASGITLLEILYAALSKSKRMLLHDQYWEENSKKGYQNIDITNNTDIQENEKEIVGKYIELLKTVVDSPKLETMKDNLNIKKFYDGIKDIKIEALNSQKITNISSIGNSRLVKSIKKIQSERENIEF